jgi:glucose/arabinose dehydrogenase
VVILLAAGIVLVAGILQAVLPAFMPVLTPQAEMQTISWPQINLTLVASGLENPVFITNAGDNSGRIFIVEQRGSIHILLNGQLSSAFLDISGRVRSPFSGGGSEQGLLSLAFPPGYSQKGYFYVYYTNLDGDNQVSRFHLGKDANTADPANEQLILLLTHPKNATNHNGGQLAFGPDGYLYIGVGDGGSTPQNGQNTDTLLGKILRIDVEGKSAQPVSDADVVNLPLVLNAATPGQTTSSSYSIPADNPFVGVSGYRSEIWAFGLRNPWRFSFDGKTNDLYIADVGQSSWEEVDFQPGGSPGGQNYGWAIMEGLDCNNAASCSTSSLALPVYVRATHEAGSCALIGGYVYRGTKAPSLQGIYFMGDYCSGAVWGLKQAGGSWQSQQLTATSFKITSFGEDQAGELYLADANGGIYQITANPP